MSRAKPWPKHGSQIQRSKASTPLPKHLQRHEQKKHPVRLKTPGPCPRGVTAWHMKRGLEKMEVKGQVSSELTSSQILAPLHQEPGLLQTTAQRCKRMRRPQRSPWPPPACPISCLICPCLSTTRPVHCLSSPSPVLSATCSAYH